MKREIFARQIAEDGLGCINAAYDWAYSESQQGFRLPNVMNPGAEVNALIYQNRRAEYDKTKSAFKVMLATPVLARVKYSDEDERQHEVYIVRGPKPSIEPFRTASHNSPIARLASLKPGDGELLNIDNKEHDLIVSEVITFQPRRDQDSQSWDSIDTRIDSENDTTYSILSLLKFLNREVSTGSDPWAEDDDSVSLIDGFRRDIRSGFGLRDNPILDKVQRDISLLNLNSICFISGPAGTGKTTTLIRRLGLKTDKNHLRDQGEFKAAETIEAVIGRRHEDSWIMFSPTDLLKEYVKEAFEREGQFAPKDRLRTWSAFRREIARDTLRIIRNAQRQTGLILVENDEHLIVKPSDIMSWYEDFEAFKDQRDRKIILDAAALLAASEESATAQLGENLQAALSRTSGTSLVALIKTLEHFYDQLEDFINRNDKNVGEKITNRLITIGNKNAEFPKELLAKIIEIRDSSLGNDDSEENGSDASGLSDDNERSKMTRARARGNAVRYIRTYGFNRARGRKSQDGSAASRLLSWLGSDLNFTTEDIMSLGRTEREIRAARALLRQDRNVITRLVPSYRVFRRSRLKDGTYYSAMPSNQSYISSLELDVLTLSALRSLREMDELRGDICPERKTILRAQVLVDEATDFSPVQLCAMREVAYPEGGSFFMSGDLNQRLIETGLTDFNLLKKIDPNLQLKYLNISYRQSKSLLQLGSAIAKLGLFENANAEYAGYNDNDSPKPEWKSGLNTAQLQTDWLAEKIAYIDEAGSDRRISIAIFVSDEEAAKSLIPNFNTKIAHTGREVVNCSDGRAVTETQHIGIYNIDHIKGLEFEAVFFVGLDRIMAVDSVRALTTLYVGATRAANYLAVSFESDIPEFLLELQPHFLSD